MQSRLKSNAPIGSRVISEMFFWKYDPPPEVHLQLPALQQRLWLLHWSDKTDGPCTRYWLQISPSEPGHGATPVLSWMNVRSLKLSSSQTHVSILCTLLPHLLQQAYAILLWYSEACFSWPTCTFSNLVVRCRCHMPFCSNQHFVSQPHFSQLDCIFWQVMGIFKA